MRCLYILCLFLASQIPASADTFLANSQNSFDIALSQSRTGDTILWEEGIYEDIYLNVAKDGLFISASKIGGTIFTGDSYVRLDGDNLTFRGFQFVDGNIGTKDIVNIRGSNILFTQINMRGYTCYKYLRIREESQYVTVLNCNFENRLNLDDQNILSILVDANQPGYHKIQYCSFKNFEGIGADQGIEPIRIGLSTQADRKSRSLVEYCYFTNCDGDGEIISSKASQNVYRYNTFENNTKAELVLRHGSEAIVYGNFFLNGKGGVRVREGQNHYIYNNYFYELDDRAIYLQNHNSNPLDDINIAFNLIHDCSEIILGGDGNDPPTNVTLYNNIFSDPDDRLFEDPTGTETWISNIASGNLGFPTPTGISIVDPQLEKNERGFFGLKANSPAINAALSGYKSLPDFEGIESIDSLVVLDLMKEIRPDEISLKDLGCSEYPHEKLIQPMATEENTGTHYNSSIITSVKNEDLDNEYKINVFPNPTSERINIELFLEKTMDVKIALMNMEGRLIQTLDQTDQVSGSLLYTKDLDSLANGIYFLNISGSNKGIHEFEKNIKLYKK